MIGKLNLLWDLFDEVYISTGVYREVFISDEVVLRGQHELKEAINNGKIKIYEVQDQLLVAKLINKLHRGEVETIIGGIELDVDFVVIDEKAARNQAINSLLTPLGTIGILRLAKERKLIGEIREYLDILISEGYRLSKSIYNRALELEAEK
jgi:predicted nucleic acid-binding protein